MFLPRRSSAPLELPLFSYGNYKYFTPNGVRARGAQFFPMPLCLD